MKKLKVGILFGGKSAEHEVSLQSARNVFEAIDRSKYEPVLIGISKDGRWLLNDESNFLLDADDPERIRLNPQGCPVTLAPENKGALSLFQANRRLDSGEERFVDVVFPILHGPFGEDGTVQGLLKLADVPFVGAGVLGSAVGMDKVVMKRLLRDGGIPIGKFIALKSHEKIPPFEEIAAELGQPFFVKPANMGSSVGVNKVHNKDEYAAAVNDAFNFDIKILFEEFIRGREIECAVLGNEEPEASVTGEVKSTHEFYSYDAKYIDENGAILEFPASINEESAQKIRELAIKTFRILECEGLGRVDFFLEENGGIIVNEINTMPGFTRISMYPKLWEASGLSYTNLITRLIELAVKRFEKEKKIRTSAG
ncbi:MAG: D-alanine--D-alanine ligase [Treponema sp.]|jgi:D-alanine-D-alanine ligase|nr:D-alanine--D-alanine ligase [Treponema sp.]